MTCKYTQLSNFLCKFRKSYPPLHKNRYYCLCILCTVHVHLCFVFSLLTSRNPNKISEYTKIDFRSLEGIKWKRPMFLCCRLIWFQLLNSHPQVIKVPSLPLPYYFFSLCNVFALLTPAGGGGGRGTANNTTTKKPGPLSFFVPFYMMHAYWEILVALILNFPTTGA
jgi:hypothetical protein